MKDNTTLKYNCCVCKRKVIIQTVFPANRVLKICPDCLLDYNKEQRKEYIPYVEEE